MADLFDHILDPNGDVKLILKNPDAAFAAWPEDTLTLPEDAKQKAGCMEFANFQRQSVRFRVSSRHLALASQRSKRLRSDAWTPHMDSDGFVEEVFEDWHEKALLIVLNIIHGHNRYVPKTLSLEMLAKVAVIVDYLECHEAVEPFTDKWVAELHTSWPKSYNRDLILRLSISHIFGEVRSLEILKSLAIAYSVGQFQDLGLPIPDSIIKEIEQKRENGKTYIISKLSCLLEEYENEQRGCSRACRCGVVGALWLEFRAYGLFPHDTHSSCEYSLDEMYRGLQRGSSKTGREKKHRDRLCCELDKLIKPIIEEIDCCYYSDIKKLPPAWPHTLSPFNQPKSLFNQLS